MLTAAALLELDFEQPSLDYHSLMKLTKILTKDHYADVESMFRRMCFLLVLTARPWVWFPPGICIILVVVGFNFIGEGVRDALDPKTK